VTGDSLRVAYDVTPAISGNTGIARYVNQLARALELQAVEVRRFAVGRARFPPPPGTRRLPVPARWLALWWQTVGWPPAELLAGGGELVHATGLVVPPTRRPLVMTVHDTAAIHYPELHPARDVLQLRAQLAALERAAVVLAVSEATARDLIELGVPAARLVVAPLGVTPMPAAEALDGLPARYVLTVGETSPRKGYGVLLEALSRIGPGVELVMAGPPAGDEQRLRSLAEQLHVAPRVTRLGAVTDAQLAGVYCGALALCFPSVAEGFGLPVLEAMAAGVPVLATDIAPVRELLGADGVLIEGGDADSWAEAIDAVARDEDLRERLSRAQRERAAEYTWERTAAATLRAYQLAVGALGSPANPAGRTSPS
jgi:glycosyltransferase involved in cell wall biosynthesis